MNKFLIEFWIEILPACDSFRMPLNGWDGMEWMDDAKVTRVRRIAKMYVCVCMYVVCTYCTYTRTCTYVHTYVHSSGWMENMEMMRWVHV